MPRNNRRNNQNNNRREANLPQITFDYENNPQLFGEVAQRWAEQLENESNQQVNKSSQIRQFYDRVIELYEKSINIEDAEYKRKIYPFVVMLNSKVAYAKTRNKVSDTFVRMISRCVAQANSKKGIETFKLFFEAVIGFYPKR
jgi:CRISPR-associated protein Csm2